MSPAIILSLLLQLGPAAVQEGPQAALDRLGSDDPAERRRAQDELFRRGAEGVSLALQALETSAPDPAPQVERWVKQLSSPKWMDRDEAMRALVGLGRPAKGALEAKARSGDPEVAWRVRAALAEVQERAGREDARDEARNLAICELLGESGDARGVAPVLRFLETGGPELKLRAAAAAGRLRDRMDGAQAEEAAGRVLGLLDKASGPLPKSVVIRALGRLRASPALRPLAQLVADRNERNVHVKLAALAALAEGGDPRGLKAVVDALLMDDPYVRQGAAGVLERVSGAPLGFDARAGIEENRAAIEKARAWWAKRAGREWED